EIFDFGISGAGANGSELAKRLAEDGYKVIVWDHSTPPYGETGAYKGGNRMFREALGEGPQYINMVPQSIDILLRDQAEAKKLGLDIEVLRRTGVLFIQIGAEGGNVHGREDFIKASIEVAQRSHPRVDYQFYSCAQEIVAAHPAFTQALS